MATFERPADGEDRLAESAVCSPRTDVLMCRSLCLKSAGLDVLEDPFSTFELIHPLGTRAIGAPFPLTQSPDDAPG